MNHQQLYPDPNTVGLDTSTAAEAERNEEEGYTHYVLVRLLETVHCHYQILDGEKNAWDWPWETNLEVPASGHSIKEIGGIVAVNNSRGDVGVVVPGNVQVLIKHGEDLEDIFENDLLEGVDGIEDGGGENDNGAEANGPVPEGVPCYLGEEFEEVGMEEEISPTRDDGAAADGEGKDIGNAQDGSQEDGSQEDGSQDARTGDKEKETAAAVCEDVQDVNCLQNENGQIENNDTSNDDHDAGDEGEGQIASKTEVADTGRGSNNVTAPTVSEGNLDHDASMENVAEENTKANTDITSTEQVAPPIINSSETVGNYSSAMASPTVEQGNVAELFQNFEDVDEIENVLGDLSLPEETEALVGDAPTPPPPAVSMAAASVTEMSCSQTQDRANTHPATGTAASLNPGNLLNDTAMPEAVAEKRVETSSDTPNKMATEHDSSSSDSVGQHLQQSVKRISIDQPKDSASQFSQDSQRNNSRASFVGIDAMMEDDSEDEEEEEGEQQQPILERSEENQGKECQESTFETQELLFTQPLLTQPEESTANNALDENEEGEESQILLSQVSKIGRASLEVDGKDGRSESQTSPPAQIPTIKKDRRRGNRRCADEEECMESEIPLSMRKVPPETLGALGDTDGVGEPKESQIPLATITREKMALQKQRSGLEAEEEEKGEEEKNSHLVEESQIPLPPPVSHRKMTLNPVEHLNSDGDDDDLSSTKEYTGEDLCRNESQVPFMTAAREAPKALQEETEEDSSPSPEASSSLLSQKKIPPTMALLDGPLDKGREPTRSQIHFTTTREVRKTVLTEKSAEEKRGFQAVESQIPFPRRKTESKRRQELDDTEEHAPSRDVWPESQIPLPPPRKKKTKRLNVGEGLNRHDSKKGQTTEKENRRESQIPLLLIQNKSKQTERHEKQKGNKKCRKVFDELTFADPSILTKKAKPFPRRKLQLSCQAFRGSDSDSSDDWMRVVHSNIGKSKPKASNGPKFKKNKKMSPTTASAATQHTNDAAENGSANDQVLESLETEMAAGEGSEESQLLPSIHPQSLFVQQKNTATTKRLQFKHGGDSGNDVDVELSAQQPIQKEDDIIVSQEEAIHEPEKQQTPLAIAPNIDSSAQGDDDHHVRFAINQLEQSPCDMSSIAARAGTLLGSTTSRYSLQSGHFIPATAANDGSMLGTTTVRLSLQSGHFIPATADQQNESEDMEEHSSGKAENDNNQRKQRGGSVVGIDMVQILERAKRLCGL